MIDIQIRSGRTRRLVFVINEPTKYYRIQRALRRVNIKQFPTTVAIINTPDTYSFGKIITPRRLNVYVQVLQVRRATIVQVKSTR